MPKSLFASTWPDVRLIAYPPGASPAIATHFVFAGRDCVQPPWRTSQTTYLPGFSESEYVPAAPVVAEAAIVDSPAWSTPSPLVSAYARMTQPERTGSPWSRTPLRLMSSNFRPDFVALR